MCKRQTNIFKYHHININWYARDINICTRHDIILKTLSYQLFIGIGIALYGLAYFLIHEIIIHRRIPHPNKTNNNYIKAIRKAHKVHHKNRTKHNGVNFGMLIVPLKYFKK